VLESGSQIGPYEVIGPLGAGGMGEVVRARDSRLGREVAIKTLPDPFAQDPERLARFEREARLLATLHHPNIAGIYGVEEAAGHRHLILQLVEGETLAARIDRGPLPLEEALDVARQIALALEFAHENGVIHRDLKPGNVKITPGGEVKVLDFGLAKGQVGSTTSADLSNSPTLSASPTGVGVILGTAAYMSPEQARGRPVDRRTDIWSFGCVLYEMLAGRQLFQGETVTDILARILQSEPDWSALPAATPQRIRALLGRCLRKDPKERLRDIGDARIEISEVLAGGPASADATPARARTAWPARIGLLLLGAALAAVLFTALATRPVRSLRSLALDVPGLGDQIFDGPALSHDGHSIAYSADGHLFVRDLSQFEPTPLPGTEAGSNVAWSADDRRLCFVKDGKLWVTAGTGGGPAVVCTLPDPGSTIGEVWTPDGDILFTVFRGGLYRVPASGGSPRLVRSPEADEEDFHVPQLLPDGRRVLVVAHRKHGAFPIVAITLADGKRTDLRAYDRLLCAVLSPEGYLLLFRERPSAIEAVRFSPATMRFAGDPVRIAPGGMVPSVSNDGALAYILDGAMGLRQLVWIDTRGHVEDRIGEPQIGLAAGLLSRDGKRIVYGATDGDVQNLFTLDLERGVRTRVVADSNDKVLPVWSADGRSVFYSSSQTAPEVWEVTLDGSAPPHNFGPGYWPVPTPDGKTLLVVHEERGHESIWSHAISGNAVPQRLWRVAGIADNQPALSRDGRWLAYTSDESGANEVYVRSYPGGAGKQLVSRDGGTYPLWTPDGTLLYATRDSAFRVATRADGGTLRLSGPRALFAFRDVGDHASITDVARDGRLLGTVRSPDDPRRGILIVENWSVALRRR
jgi:Tol biopolymer transport system component